MIARRTGASRYQQVLPIARPQPAAGSSEAVGFATLEWFGCFNDWGLLELIGNIPPAETGQRCYLMLEQSANVT